VLVKVIHLYIVISLLSISVVNSYVYFTIHTPNSRFISATIYNESSEVYKIAVTIFGISLLHATLHFTAFVHGLCSIAAVMRKLLGVIHL